MIYQCSPAVASTLQAVHPYLHETATDQEEEGTPAARGRHHQVPKTKGRYGQVGALTGPRPPSVEVLSARQR